MVPHNGDVAATSATNREEYLRRGRRLEYFTIGYNSLEGVISIGRAAELLHLSPDRFPEVAAAHGVPYFEMTDGEWEAERRAAERL